MTPYYKLLTLNEVLAIPARLLWKVRIKLSQKLGLAGFLCLSMCMILMAIIRMSGLMYRDNLDIAWIYLWQQVEACTAVTMLSLTAFRSFFIAANSRPNKSRPLIHSTRKWPRRHGKPAAQNHGLDDLTIPSATLTGLDRIFNRSQGAHSIGESFYSESWPLTPTTLYEPFMQV